jgi:hypothetical protein
MASRIVDRTDVLDLMWDAHRAGPGLTASLLSPGDEGSSIGAPGNGRDPRHAVIPAPLHLAPPPRQPPGQLPRQPPRHIHPRDARILPRSRDFH